MTDGVRMFFGAIVIFVVVGWVWWTSRMLD